MQACVRTHGLFIRGSSNLLPRLHLLIVMCRPKLTFPHTTYVTLSLNFLPLPVKHFIPEIYLYVSFSEKCKFVHKNMQIRIQLLFLAFFPRELCENLIPPSIVLIHFAYLSFFCYANFIKFNYIRKVHAK